MVADSRHTFWMFGICHTVCNWKDSVTFAQLIQLRQQPLPTSELHSWECAAEVGANFILPKHVWGFLSVLFLFFLLCFSPSLSYQGAHGLSKECGEASPNPKSSHKSDLFLSLWWIWWLHFLSFCLYFWLVRAIFEIQALSAWSWNDLFYVYNG